MGRQGHDTSAAAPGMRIQRSQSKMSLSASFEALAVYFPCMNSFDEEDGGKVTARGDQRHRFYPECKVGFCVCNKCLLIWSKSHPKRLPSFPSAADDFLF